MHELFLGGIPELQLSRCGDPNADSQKTMAFENVYEFKKSISVDVLWFSSMRSGGNLPIPPVENKSVSYFFKSRH